MRDFSESQLPILESGHGGHSDNVSTLARKYLTVYAIVMGEIDFIRNPSLSDFRPKVQTGSRVRTCIPCTTKSMHFQSERLPYFL